MSEPRRRMVEVTVSYAMSGPTAQEEALNLAISIEEALEDSGLTGDDGVCEYLGVFIDEWHGEQREDA